MGEIRKRGKVYQIRYYRNGRRIEETPSFTKWEDARDHLRDREGDISKGVPITAKSTKLTFDDAVKDVIADYTVNAKKSTEGIKRRVKLHLTPAFGGRKLSAPTTADFRAFAARRLEAKAAAAEINRELAIVRRVSVSGRSRQVSRPSAEVPVLQERNVRSGFFDDEMIEAVKARLPEALRPVVTFAYITGWRV
jgi:hypothetical protein